MVDARFPIKMQSERKQGPTKEMPFMFWKSSRYMSKRLMTKFTASHFKSLKMRSPTLRMASQSYFFLQPRWVKCTLRQEASLCIRCINFTPSIAVPEIPSDRYVNIDNLESTFLCRPPTNECLTHEAALKVLILR